MWHFLRFPFVVLLIRLAFSLVFVVSAASATSIKAEPHYKKVALKEFTNLDLHIVPDLGTRLIFPFVLTNESHRPNFTYKLTNGAYFKLTQGEEIKGQNSFVIYFTPPRAGGELRLMLADFFMSVDGYNVSIRLHTTNKLNQHVRNVVFDITDTKRTAMIERQVDYRVKKVNEEMKAKEARIKEQAKEIAKANLGVIALYKPHSINIKKRVKNKLLTGERVDLVISKSRNYHDEFYMIDFSIDNKSPKEIMIESVVMSSLSDNTDETINTTFYCKSDKSVSPESKSECVVISSDPTLGKADRVKLEIGTNRGTLGGEW